MKATIRRSLSLVILSLTVVVFFSACSDSHIGRAEIRDLVLIYDGGDHRRVNWDKEQFSPYVFKADAEGNPEEWLFDGFLFLEIKCNADRGFATGYRKGGAQKEHWVGLIDQYLTPGKDIAALDECIAEARKSIPGKFYRRKVVLSLPEPLLGQTDWGELDGRPLDFNLDADRVAACRWYIDLLMDRFEEAGLDNVQLCGFYWLAEHVTETVTFVKEVSDYIHEKGLDFYWIPYFKANGYERWKEWGFDHAYLQPNHFFHPQIPDSRIDEACSLAAEAGLSMEMEFDERVLENVGNRGDRMEAYMDSYQRNAVFETRNVAYYQGDNAWSSLSQGTERDRQLYMRLAEIIAERQRKFYKY